MWSTFLPTSQTVGDVLCRPVSARSASLRPPSPHRGTSEGRAVFLTETDVQSTRHMMPLLRQVSILPKSRVQSAPGPRHSPDTLQKATLPFSRPRCSSAKLNPTRHQVHTVQRTRRPVDEALFCALRMEGEDTVATQLRQLGPERLTSNFRSLCSRLSMHHVTAAQFTFLCAAVLNTTVSQRDCEVVFAFLRAEQGAGSLDVADLLLRLRTLFVSPGILCALQLKRMLETNALSECTVSIDELHKAFAGLQRLLGPGALRKQVDLQWRSLHDELSRIHVQYAVFVPTFRAAARRLAPTLCSIVRTLLWDGSWAENSVEEKERATDAPLLSSSFSLPRQPQQCATSAPLRAVAPTTLPSIESAVSHTTVLSTVENLYHQRLQEQDAATAALASDAFRGKYGGAVAARRAGRHSSWRASLSAVDVTNPHFVADMYATGHVTCPQK